MIQFSKTIDHKDLFAGEYLSPQTVSLYLLYVAELP